MVEVLVEYDYTAEQEDELSIKVGDIIHNVSKQDGGWWEGELNGKRGVFPDNFVKVMSDKPKPKEDPSSPPMEIPKKPATQRSSHITELMNKVSQNVGVMGAPMPIKKREKVSDVPKKLRCRACYSYNAENEDELALEVGDELDILKQDEEGWWQGTMNGKVGVFPSNFVEVIKDGEQTPDEKEDGDVDGNVIPGRKIKGVGLGNIFQGGPIKLRSTSAKINNNQPESKTRTVNAETKRPLNRESEPVGVVLEKRLPPPPPDPAPSLPPREVKPIERARVLFSYSAENEDELSLEEGATIVVLDKELEDSGWWKGEMDGKVGVFPDNFVELLPHEEPKPKRPAPPSAVTKPNKFAEKRLPPEPPKPEKTPPPLEIRPKKDVTKEKRDDKPEKVAPALPSKKPMLPPPVSKKPHPPRPSDHKPMAPSDDHKVKESQKDAPEKPQDANGFDSIESTEKLTHLTAHRAKRPNKRPPSQILLHKDNSEEENSPDTASSATEPPWSKDIKKSTSLKRGTTPPAPEPEPKEPKDTPKPEEEKKKPAPSKVQRPPPPVSIPKHSNKSPPKDITDSKSPRSPSEEPKVVGVSSPINSGGGGASSEDVRELRKELQLLRDNTVSRDTYNALKTDYNSLRKDLDGLRSQFNKRIMELMTEIDEEKKTRLTMQVELDRLKKIVTTT